MAELNKASFLFGSNAAFLGELYAHYLEDPSSVDASWRQLFEELKDDAGDLLAEIDGPSWSRESFRIIQNGKNGHADEAATTKPATEIAKPNGQAVDLADARRMARDSISALMLIRVYRVRGHLLASLDPLNLQEPHYHSELDYKSYGFTEADLDRKIFINNVLGLEFATLREIVEILKKTYCGTVGVEYMHIQDPAEKAWIQERIEGARNQTQFDTQGRKQILTHLTEAEAFERFLDKRFTGTKRFGLEGGESLVPALQEIIAHGGATGIKEIVVGMPHRGRLNVLANVMRKPFHAIFSEFQGNSANPDDVQGSGDVKYHLGTSSDREIGDKIIHLSLTANPSHLEAVDPVVLGKVRAKHHQRHDTDRSQVMGLLMHGDAAFAGQGLVAETLELSELKGYRTGGTIHLVVNNQIGFTTSPYNARSGQYCSDIAKIVQAPIFHVNGDDPEAVVHVARMAVDYRQRFKKDVVVDMFCYRRHGHNEADEPAFTQPLMYRKIAEQPTTREIYARRLESAGVLVEGEAAQIQADFMARLDSEFDTAKSYKPNKADWLEGVWSGFKSGSQDDQGKTSVTIEFLKEVGRVLTTVPSDFTANRKIVRQLQEKAQMFETGAGFDWGTCEALAFGTLAAEGFGVRLSGQDSGRGTFSHRHAVLYDQQSERQYIPLCHVHQEQGLVEIVDSPLSEAAVLGFDYGYSLAEPKALVLWEAQFGDFANGAQVIIDQFISSAESKWLRMSGLTMLLPHGYEGQGPEHSSARLERYLQLCAEDNIQVCNISTPANYFHVLRRQMHRSFRKPLIITAPKSLLRAKLSSLVDMGPGTSFRRVYGEVDALAPDEKIRRVVLCTGKLYYEIAAQRADQKIDDVAILRLEQLYPFPGNTLFQELKRYPHAELVWAQEEPENMGGWSFLDRKLEQVLTDLGSAAKRPIYVGRKASAASATGSMKRHLAEQKALIAAALAPQ